MKVLFIGEGDHDIGPPGVAWGQPRAAAGVVSTLARRVCPWIAEGSIALQWNEIPRFSPKARKGVESPTAPRGLEPRGFEKKVAAAILLSARRFDCAGTVCVTDRDGDPDRLDAMVLGKQRGLDLIETPHAAAVGVAVESIEAWTLGAPRAVAEELGVPLKSVRARLPTKHVEALRESSGTEEHRPKALVDRLAALGRRHGGVEFRCAVADRTEVQELVSACPEGFAPFAAALRAAFT